MNCGPPRPDTIAPGASATSSRVRAPAYRSPDASPQESRRRAVTSRAFEQTRIDRGVDLDVGHVTLENRLAAAAHRRRVGDSHAVDIAVVAECLFDNRLAWSPGHVGLL